jgi:hypothetical protein
LRLGAVEPVVSSRFEQPASIAASNSPPITARQSAARGGAWIIIRPRLE